MPSIYVPDKLAYLIVKLGEDPKRYVRDAIVEKLARDGVVIPSEYTTKEVTAT